VAPTRVWNDGRTAEERGYRRVLGVGRSATPDHSDSWEITACLAHGLLVFECLTCSCVQTHRERLAWPHAGCGRQWVWAGVDGRVQATQQRKQKQKQKRRRRGHTDTRLLTAANGRRRLRAAGTRIARRARHASPTAVSVSSARTIEQIERSNSSAMRGDQTD